MLETIYGSTPHQYFGTSIESIHGRSKDKPAIIVVGCGDGTALVVEIGKGTTLATISLGHTSDLRRPIVPVCDDLNVDGVPDVAAGAPWVRAPERKLGFVMFTPGADGSILGSVECDEDHYCFGRSLELGPDLDSDGARDMFEGATPE